jgi:hypothetical protein
LKQTARISEFWARNKLPVFPGSEPEASCGVSLFHSLFLFGRIRRLFKPNYGLFD